MFVTGTVAHSHTQRELERPCQCDASEHTCWLSSEEQATAAAAAGSTDRRHQHCCQRASLTLWSHSRRYAVMSRTSTCGASTHAARVRTGTAGQWERTLTSVAAVLVHGASRPARCSIPRRCPSHSSRSTYAARSQPSGGVLSPDKVSNTLRDEGSMASTVSASDARMRRSDAAGVLRRYGRGGCFQY